MYPYLSDPVLARSVAHDVMDQRLREASQRALARTASTARRPRKTPVVAPTRPRLHWAFPHPRRALS